MQHCNFHGLGTHKYEVSDGTSCMSFMGYGLLRDSCAYSELDGIIPRLLNLCRDYMWNKTISQLFSLRRHPTEIILFQRAETCLKLFQTNVFRSSSISSNTLNVARILK